MNGIDISSWQSNLNLATLDVDFAILKLSEGRTWADPSFDAFYAQAKVPVGAYVFSRATTVQMAEQEAEKALSLLNGRPCQLGVYIDVEAHEQLALPDNQLTAVIAAFCNVIRLGGYAAGVYGSAGQLWARVSPLDLGEVYVWIAQWSNNPPKQDCDIWQYTDHAHLNGYAGNLDGDKAMSDRFKALLGKGVNAPTKDDSKDDFCEVSAKMPVLSFGSKGLHVKLMQTALIGKGFNCGWMGADGDFGQQTKIALYQFSGETTCTANVWKKLLEV